MQRRNKALCSLIYKNPVITAIIYFFFLREPQSLKQGWLVCNGVRDFYGANDEADHTPGILGDVLCSVRLDGNDRMQI